jgi:hypothetical protein
MLRYPTHEFYNDDMPLVVFTPYVYTLPVAEIFGSNIKREKSKELFSKQCTLFMPGTFSENVGSEWAMQDVIGGAGNDLRQALGAGFGKTLDSMATGGASILGNTIKGGAGKSTLPSDVNIFSKAKPATFTLGFNFMPFNATEAKLAIDICQMFKTASLPGISTSGAWFLSWPDIWDVDFVNFEGAGVGKNSVYKDMALVNVDVTMSSNSTNMLTYRDGMPLELSLKLSFASVRRLFNELPESEKRKAEAIITADQQAISARGDALVRRAEAGPNFMYEKDPNPPAAVPAVPQGK